MTNSTTTWRRARIILPALYLLLCLYIWLDFVSLPPDGLANLSLFAVTLPVSLAGLALGWAIGADAFPLLPDGPGYLASHAFHFVPAAAATAFLLYLLGRAIDRRRA